LEDATVVELLYLPAFLPLVSYVLTHKHVSPQAPARFSTLVLQKPPPPSQPHAAASTSCRTSVSPDSRK
jgi:hypothetical protein